MNKKDELKPALVERLEEEELKILELTSQGIEKRIIGEELNRTAAGIDEFMFKRGYYIDENGNYKKKFKINKKWIFSIINGIDYKVGYSRIMVERFKCEQKTIEIVGLLILAIIYLFVVYILNLIFAPLLFIWFGLTIFVVYIFLMEHSI